MTSTMLNIDYSIGKFLSNVPQSILSNLTISTEIYLREVLHFIMQNEANVMCCTNFREPYSLTEFPKTVVEALTSQKISVVSSSTGIYYLEWKRGFYIPLEK